MLRSRVGSRSRKFWKGRSRIFYLRLRNPDKTGQHSFNSVWNITARASARLCTCRNRRALFYLFDIGVDVQFCFIFVYSECVLVP